MDETYVNLRKKLYMKLFSNSKLKEFCHLNNSTLCENKELIWWIMVISPSGWCLMLSTQISHCVLSISYSSEEYVSEKKMLCSNDIGQNIQPKFQSNRLCWLDGGWRGNHIFKKIFFTFASIIWFHRVKEHASGTPNICCIKP